MNRNRTGVLYKVVHGLRSDGLHETMRRAVFRAALFLATLRASARMRSSVSVQGIEESVEFAYDFSIGDVSIAPAQIRSEIEDLLRRVQAEPPQRILEIGTARGGTLFLLSRVAQREATLLSIDLPGGAFGITWRRESTLLLRQLALRSQTLCLIRADSHCSETLSSVRRVLDGEPLDFLMIDGDHRYDGVRMDFGMYGPLVRARGLIAFHDIVPGPQEMVGGVPTFWNELRHNFETLEIVDDWKQEGFGIGLLRVPAAGLSPQTLSR